MASADIDICREKTKLLPLTCFTYWFDTPSVLWNGTPTIWKISIVKLGKLWHQLEPVSKVLCAEHLLNKEGRGLLNLDNLHDEIVLGTQVLKSRHIDTTYVYADMSSVGKKRFFFRQREEQEWDLALKTWFLMLGTLESNSLLKNMIESQLRLTRPN